jgi:tRNA (guanine-N7-)-methyltransferase
MRQFHAEHIPKPALDFSVTALNAARSLDLEIGAGQGLHAIRYALSHPERDLIALEKTHERFARLDGRKKSHPQATNLYAFHADAVAFVTHFLPDASLDTVYLLYPNPYPKAKQANLRWHNRPFFGLLLTKMKPGASFMLATNLEWYAREAQAAFDTVWGMSSTLAPIDPALPPRTHFEKKYLERGETCWNVSFRKLASCQTPPTPVQ